jgi:hypothetical protein
VLHLVGSPFEVADALKMYLRSAPVAVVPATVFDSWIASRRPPMSTAPELADLHDLVHLLDEPAMQALRTLVQLLCDLAARSSVNQLTPAALGVLLANTIIGNSEAVPDPTIMLYRNKVLAPTMASRVDALAGAGSAHHAAPRIPQARLAAFNADACASPAGRTAGRRAHSVARLVC